MCLGLNAITKYQPRETLDSVLVLDSQICGTTQFRSSADRLSMPP